MESNNKLQELIGDKLLKVEDGNLADVSFNDFKSLNADTKYLCFYFGAHWAPPSRLFTTTLMDKFY